MFELAAIAARQPRAAAIRGPGGTVCYADLADRVAARTVDLRGAGPGAGERVILGCAPTIETVVIPSAAMAYSSPRSERASVRLMWGASPL